MARTLKSSIWNRNPTQSILSTGPGPLASIPHDPELAASLDEDSTPLLDLRLAWLDTNDVPHRLGPAAPSHTLPLPSPWHAIKSLYASIRRAIAVRRTRYDATSETSSAVLRLGLVAIVTVVILCTAGALLTTGFQFLLGPDRFSQTVEPDPGTLATANPPAPPPVANASALPAPDPEIGTESPDTTNTIGYTGGGDGARSQFETTIQNFVSTRMQGQQDSNAGSAVAAGMLGATSTALENQARPQIAQGNSNGQSYSASPAAPPVSRATNSQPMTPAAARLPIPASLPSLNSTHASPAPTSTAGDPQTAALASIQRGGSAAFELQHLHAPSAGTHPARLVITATTLSFVPQAAGDSSPRTIPLASIASVETSQSQLSIKLKDANGNAAASGQLLFGDSTQSSSQLSVIRSIILAAKSHSRP